MSQIISQMQSLKQSSAESPYLIKCHDEVKSSITGSCAMKTITITLSVLILLAMMVLPSGAQFKSEAPGVGEYFPPFAGVTPDGEAFDLANHYNAGMYLLIDFWAFWCGPCKREVPNIVDAWKQFGGKKFIIVGVNMDTPKTEADMLKYIEDNEMTFPIVTELGGWNTSIAKERKIRYIPQNFLLAPDGTVLFRDLRGEDVVNIVRGLMESPRLYEPIMMETTVQDDPRDEDGWRSWSPDYEQFVNPFGRALNTAPDSIRIRIHIDNGQADRYKAVLWYKLYRPTGKKTHWVTDQATGEVQKHYRTGKPYIVYEAEVEEVEVPIEVWDNELNTGYEIPLGPDVWEVRWGLKVHSDWIDLDVEGGQDDIDFAGYWTMTPEMIAENGGYFFAPKEKE